MPECWHTLRKTSTWTTSPQPCLDHVTEDVKCCRPSQLRSIDRELRTTIWKILPPAWERGNRVFSCTAISHPQVVCECYPHSMWVCKYWRRFQQSLCVQLPWIHREHAAYSTHLVVVMGVATISLHGCPCPQYLPYFRDYHSCSKEFSTCSCTNSSHNAWHRGCANLAEAAQDTWHWPSM
jgi:hypothetical protein